MWSTALASDRNDAGYFSDWILVGSSSTLFTALAAVVDADIYVELQRGSAKLTVRWPSSQAGACAAWLRELAAGTLK